MLLSSYEKAYRDSIPSEGLDILWHLQGVFQPFGQATSLQRRITSLCFPQVPFTLAIAEAGNTKVEMGGQPIFGSRGEY